MPIYTIEDSIRGTGEHITMGQAYKRCKCLNHTKASFPLQPSLSTHRGREGYGSLNEVQYIQLASILPVSVPGALTLLIARNERP